MRNLPRQLPVNTQIANAHYGELLYLLGKVKVLRRLEYHD
jgi:hypothetical protein